MDWLVVVVTSISVIHMGLLIIIIKKNSVLLKRVQAPANFWLQRSSARVRVLGSQVVVD